MGIISKKIGRKRGEEGKEGGRQVRSGRRDAGEEGMERVKACNPFLMIQFNARLTPAVHSLAPRDVRQPRTYPDQDVAGDGETF